jgi:hypothetical protein
VINMNKEKFYEAWEWLDKNPLFAPWGDSDGTRCLDITVVKVNPENETIEDDDSLNTEVRIWLEGGPWSENINPDFIDEEWADWTHDIDLDCGAPTFEEAVIKFVEKVKKKYGDYGEYSPIYMGEYERGEKTIEDFLFGE